MQSGHSSLRRLTSAGWLVLTLTLLLTQQAWTIPQIALPGPPTQVVARKPPYELRIAASDTTAWVIRFKSATGETWIENLGWKRIKEGEKLPEGDYEVLIAPMKNPGRFKAYRIDRATGVTWKLEVENYNVTNATWEKIRERQD